MRNFFLYRGLNNFINSYVPQAVYLFNNKKIVAIDRLIFDRQKRNELQKELNIRPYRITQSVFKEILLFLLYNPSRVILKQISFTDEFIQDTPEYIDLENYIYHRDIMKIYECTKDIIKEYDAEIKNIVIRYQGYDFCITNQGVLSVDAPEETLINFLNDDVFNKLILG